MRLVHVQLPVDAELILDPSESLGEAVIIRGHVHLSLHFQRGGKCIQLICILQFDEEGDARRNVPFVRNEAITDHNLLTLDRKSCNHDEIRVRFCVILLRNQVETWENGCIEIECLLGFPLDGDEGAHILGVFSNRIDVFGTEWSDFASQWQGLCLNQVRPSNRLRDSNEEHDLCTGHGATSVDAIPTQCIDSERPNSARF